MSHPLHNPVYNALISGDKHLALGTDAVKYFDETVSPFVGFPDNYNGFDELHDLLPPGRKVLYATPEKIEIPKGWKLAVLVEGLQFVFEMDSIIATPSIDPVPLSDQNIDEMIELAMLTRPGPFDKRTIEFGHYFGIFENGRLASMTGQRMHVEDFTEISAVCTHPDFLGRGYAAALLQHQLRLILSQGKQPFLHVRADNARAIEIYERLGFKVSREMMFYFMKRL